MDAYQHSVILDKDRCNGCTHCLKRCPTEAIRIRGRKAVIIGERCIDCGECIRVCPYHAKDAITDTLEDLKKYKYTVAIPTAILYGQFPEGTDLNVILGAFKNIGFDEVFEAAIASDLISLIIKHIIVEKQPKKPLISSHCPAIVRLIQAVYPSLIDNIIKLETPMEVAARILKNDITKRLGYSKEEIGVFYITPCPAKMTSIKTPLGIKTPYVDGAISIKDIFPHIVREMKNCQGNERLQIASAPGVGWARVGGQSYGIGVSNYIAVDGIENVIKLLDELELGKLNDIDYFEGLACTGGCVGGPLNIENCFIAKSRIRNLTRVINNPNPFTMDEAVEIYNKGLLGWTEEILPKIIEPLDKDIKTALRKMEDMDIIYKNLPGLDCGSCGAPSCKALAEDIVRGKAKEFDCIFKLKQMVNTMA